MSRKFLTSKAGTRFINGNLAVCVLSFVVWLAACFFADTEQARVQSAMSLLLSIMEVTLGIYLGAIVALNCSTKE